MPKNKRAKLDKSNNIKNYFGSAIDPIFQDRLNEEIQAQELVELETNNVSNFAVNSTIESGDQESIAELKKRILILKEKCENLPKENTKLLKDNRALKKIVDSSKSVNLYKDFQIQKLKNRSAHEVDNVLASPSASLLYNKFTKYFTNTQLRSLRSIGKGKKSDLNFVTKCLDYLYGGDVKIIAGKCGGNKKMKEKTLITPQKKTLMLTMLNERIESEGVTDEINIERLQRLNRMIGDGIYSITKRQNHGQNASTSTLTSTQFMEIPPQSVTVPSFHPISVAAQPITITMIAQPVTTQMLTQTSQQSTSEFTAPRTSQVFDAFNFVTLTPQGQYDYSQNTSYIH